MRQSGEQAAASWLGPRGRSLRRSGPAGASEVCQESICCGGHQVFFLNRRLERTGPKVPRAKSIAVASDIRLGEFVQGHLRKFGFKYASATRNLGVAFRVKVGADRQLTKAGMSKRGAESDDIERSDSRRSRSNKASDVDSRRLRRTELEWSACQTRS